MIPDSRNCSTELADNQHSGPVEKAFKEHLLSKASENFDEAVTRKGSAHYTGPFFEPRSLLPG